MTATMPSGRTEAREILFVDARDEHVVRVRDALGAGYRIRSVTSAEIASRDRPLARPDLVLLELHSTVAAAADALGALHELPIVRDVPIVVLASTLTAAERSALLRAGSHYFLPLPVQAEELQACLETLSGDSRDVRRRLNDAEGRFAAAFDQAAVGIGLAAPDGRWLRVNRKLCDIVGYTTDEMVALTFQDVTYPDDLEADLGQVRRMLARETSTYAIEKRYVRKDGSLVWIKLTVALTWTESGDPDYFVSVVEDIDARKRAESERTSIRAKLEAMLNSMSDPAFISDTAGRFVDFNDAFATFHKFRDKDHCLKSFGEYPEILDLFSADGARAPVDQWPVRRALRGEVGSDVEYGLRRKDTGVSWSASYSFAPIRDETGGIVGAVVSARDITERKRVADALRESEERLRMFIEHAPAAIAMFDRQMRYVAVSKRWRDDYSPGEWNFLGRSHYDVYPEIGGRWKAVHRRALDGEVIRAEEDLFHRRDGRVQWLRWEVRPWRTPAGEVGGILIFTEDITERKKTEEALGESQERVASIIGSAMDAIILIDDEQRIRIFNPAAARMFGVPEDAMLGEHVERLIPSRYRPTHHEHVIDFASHGVTTRRMAELGTIFGLRSNGDEFPIEASIARTNVGGRIWMTVILRDLTERRRAEGELRQLRAEMDEMLALHVASQTAAAIAHELNQPLNAVATYSEAALRMLQAGAPKPERLEHAIRNSARQAQRAGQIMRELIDFLHKGETPVEAVDLNDIVRRAMAVVEANGFGGFQVELDLAAGLRRVWANRLQIEKVVVNLVRNGVEAMRNAGVATRTIRIVVRTAADNDMAQVTVRDSGPGVSGEHVKRVFDPFFTTKSKGVGMGLAISRALIESHGGKLWLELDSAPGAAFHFTLPFEP